MNHRVPEFDMDDFYSAPSSSGQSRQKNMQEDEIMELVWHNGQPGVQNQNQKLLRKSSPPLKSLQNHQEEQYPHQPPSYPAASPPLMPDNATSAHLFMQEEEMTSWLHYPLDDVSSFDRNLNDLIYHPPGPSAPPPAPPVPQPRQYHQTRPQSRPPPSPSAPGVNFSHFARFKARVPESGLASLRNHDVLRDSTVVDSSGTPTMGPISSFLPDSRSVGGVGGTSTVSGSISRASVTATADLMPQPPADDRKRKGKASADLFATDNQSEELEIESFEAKKQCRESGTSSSGKRSRASEVHNLSERRRRDRINEKMKALQELIPRCSKTDKASMLDEAIEYLKSLQMQLQMMSMGYYGMVPMMFPGVQQYMPMSPMGMGMGMGMDTRTNRPMIPFPAVLTAPMATPGAQASLGPRFPFPNFPMAPPVQPFDPSSVQSNIMMEYAGNQNVPPGANVGDSYQQFLGGQQMHSQQISQNPPISTPTTTSKPSSTSREAEENQSHPSGAG